MCTGAQRSLRWDKCSGIACCVITPNQQADFYRYRHSRYPLSFEIQKEDPCTGGESKSPVQDPVTSTRCALVQCINGGCSSDVRCLLFQRFFNRLVNAYSAISCCRPQRTIQPGVGSGSENKDPMYQFVQELDRSPFSRVPLSEYQQKSGLLSGAQRVPVKHLQPHLTDASAGKDRRMQRQLLCQRRHRD
jgi:hypothetical protein